MHTATRKNRLKSQNLSHQLPRNITRQLESIYAQSYKKIKKHPYRSTTNVLLSVGVVSGLFFLVRYLLNSK
jgi:hypothetical protein